VHMGHSARRQAPTPIPAPADKRFCIDLGNVGRLKLRQPERAYGRAKILARDLGIPFDRPRCDLGMHVLEPALEKFGNRLARWIDVAAIFHLSDQAGALALSLAFGALERMPFAFADSALGVMDIDHDCPMARAALADVALHLFGSLRILRMSG
jgi:hypothetical protein